VVSQSPNSKEGGDFSWLLSRTLKVLAEDVEVLVTEFYPPTARIQSGHLIWTCTGDAGQKAQPGKPTEAYKTVTVVLPLIGPEELADHTERCGRTQGAARVRARLKRQIARLVTAAAAQGGLLTLAELSVILGVGYELVRACARAVVGRDAVDDDGVEGEAWVE
jgi:hypothetical protein